MRVTEFAAADANAGGATLSVQTSGMGGALSIPAISLTIPNFSAGLNGATSGGLPNGGGQFESDLGALNYTLLGRWAYQPNSTTTFLGYSLGGFQTPAAGIPAAGTAAYAGSASAAPPAGGVMPTVNASGGAVGTLIVPSVSGGIFRTAVAGDAAVNVNFSNGAITGSLTNMKIPGSASPWHDVHLTGSLSGGSLSGTTTISGGTTSTTSTVVTAFSGNSTGRFDGALYGPNAQEIGAVWSVHDPSGKTAIGGFAAKR